jgi:predicted amino acid dehydrogenase
LNIDVSIYRMAYHESESLGMAQMMVAKKRQELVLRVARETVTKGTEATNATLDNALRDMQEQSDDIRRDPPQGDAGVLVNKTA